MRHFAVVVVGLGIFAAGGARATEASYHCADGVRLRAVFAGGVSAPGSATLTFADGVSMKLPQALSADGGRYADGDTEFWIKGTGATLTRDGRSTSCSAQ